MANHITARLAWHNDGWDGSICKNPKENMYCIGSHSYPGYYIAEQRDLEWEARDGVAGAPCGSLDSIPPCIYSINAFGKSELKAVSYAPDWLDKNANPRYFDIPPATICVWPYEEMYSDDVKRNGPGQTYDYSKRREKAEKYFDSLTEDKSLIFYYANYSNPFSEDEKKKYVLVGVSRLKSLGEIMYYEGVSQETKEKYGGGFVWQMPITSHYPEVGFRIPYHLYKDKPEILEEILFVPENDRNFKYATRKVSDDDALNLVEKLLETVDKLISIGDKSENWLKQREWLQSLIAELWEERGAYPGLPQILDYLECYDLIPCFKDEVLNGRELVAKDNIFSLLNGDLDSINNLPLPEEKLKKMRRKWLLVSEEKRKLLEDILPRFDIREEQLERLLSEERKEFGIQASLEGIFNNPYILAEQYTGDGPDDRILFNTIDHGVIPSIDLALENLLDKDSGERLRALTVEQLKRETQHTFVLAESLLKRINQKLSYFSDWSYHQFNINYYNLDREIMEEALVFRKNKDRLYIYLKEVYEDENEISEVIKNFLKRPEITLKRPLTEEKWNDWLYDDINQLAREFPEEYKEAISSQVDVCTRIFTKPLAVITGEAGTGKTHIIKNIVGGIKKTEGRGASIRLLAPTGKAADRIRMRIQDIPTSTIHSFLAERGWLNDNLTFKREGGKKEKDISTYIIDETSMLNTNMVATLFRSINWNFVKRIIFIGDPNQLPPIGRGKFFADLIKYLENIAPESLGNLTTNFRQIENRLYNKGEGILKLASLYTAEENVDEPEVDEILSVIQEGGDCFQDLRVEYWNDPEELEELIIDTIQEDIEEELEAEVPDEEFYKLWYEAHKENGNMRDDYLQIISPYRGELFGTENINLIMQDLINGHNLERRGMVGGITLFDKVIQYRNRSKSDPYYAYNAKLRKGRQKVEVYNGEIGFVKHHGYDKDKWFKPWFNLKRFQVVFSSKQEYWIGFNDKDSNKNGDVEDNIELAYAISVHKSQGSEFDRVYFVLPKNKKALLTRELLYTAVTRAKKHITIFVEEDIAPFLRLLRKESSSLKRINSSIFEFEPLPEELIHMHSWYEEGKIHQTLAEYMVRSKSEVIIANILFDRDIDFWYEKPLYASDGTFYLPDFTIVWQGEEWYWEHLGLLEKEGYRKHWEKKKEWYDKHFPGRLITTEESGNLSKEALEIIERYFTF